MFNKYLYTRVRGALSFSGDTPIVNPMKGDSFF